MNMKKIIILLFISMIALFAFAGVKLGEQTLGFDIYLDKNGTDVVRFSDDAASNGSDVSNLIFPLITESSPNEVSSIIYLHWVHQSIFSGLYIRLSFIANSTDNAVENTGYMLHKTKTTTGGMNYQVDFSFAERSTGKLNSIKFTNEQPTEANKYKASDLVSEMIAYNSENETDKIVEGGTNTSGGNKSRVRIFKMDSDAYKSPLKITMTVLKPYDKNSSGTYEKVWMEAQYVGYIKAEIINAL